MIDNYVYVANQVILRIQIEFEVWKTCVYSRSLYKIVTSQGSRAPSSLHLNYTRVFFSSS